MALRVGEGVEALAQLSCLLLDLIGVFHGIEVVAVEQTLGLIGRALTQTLDNAIGLDQEGYRILSSALIETGSPSSPLRAWLGRLGSRPQC